MAMPGQQLEFQKIGRHTQRVCVLEFVRQGLSFPFW